MRKRWLIGLILLFSLVACQAQEEALVADVPPTGTMVSAEVVATEIVATETAERTQPPPPTATAQPTATVEAVADAVETPLPTDVVPTEAPTEVVAEVVEEEGVIFGRTSEGVFFVGSEDAPVTVIDYSDFL